MFSVTMSTHISKFETKTASAEILKQQEEIQCRLKWLEDFIDKCEAFNVHCCVQDRVAQFVAAANRWCLNTLGLWSQGHRWLKHDLKQSYEAINVLYAELKQN